MYYKFDITKDTFIRSASENTNFGRDEILEIGNIVDNNDISFPNRTLLKFNITDIKSKIANNTIDSASQFILHLSEAASNERLLDEFYIDAFLLSSSWDEGTGSEAGIGYNDTANWLYRTNDNEWTTAGGDYINAISASQYYETSSGDLSINITNLVQSLSSSQYDNHGLLLKLRDENTENFNTKYFFSNHTHTIYEPKLIAKWDDSINTGSFETDDNEYLLKLKNPKNIYYKDEVIKFQFNIKEKYPTLSYYTSSVYAMPNLALNSMSYSITDVETNEELIPFSDYSKISYSGSMNYFYFNMNILDSFRTYKLKVKRNSDNTERIFDLLEFIVEE